MSARVMPDLPLEHYIRDHIPESPSLNSSLAHLLISRSPTHAWHAHPALNPEWAPVNHERFDVGSAAHALLLEGRGPESWVIIEADDYRRKETQAIREAARVDGKTPLLRKHADAIHPIVANAARKLAECPDLGSADGFGIQALASLADMEAEQTIVWDWTADPAPARSRDGAGRTG